MTQSATFPEPSRRWPPGLGRGRTGSREGLNARNKVGGRGRRRGAGAARAGGPDLRGLLFPERAGPGCGPRARAQGGGSAPRSGAAPPRLCLLRSAPTKGQARGGRGGAGLAQRAAGAQSCGVAAPGRRGAGGRSLPRAFSRRGARRSLRLPKPIGESPGAVPPFFWVISADGKLVFGKLGACAPVPGFHLGLFCFWRNYRTGGLHKSQAF